MAASIKKNESPNGVQIYINVMSSLNSSGAILKVAGVSQQPDVTNICTLKTSYKQMRLLIVILITSH